MRAIIPDKFITSLIIAMIVASLFPMGATTSYWFEIATKIAIGLLFFLHGAKLSRQAVVEGIVHWRLHLLVLAITFVVFPLTGLALGWLLPGLANSKFYIGILFLCLLPSTVQSSIAFTSIAKGNVSAAIVSASASNVIGMFITPLLAGLLLTIFMEMGAGGQADTGVSYQAILSILLQLLVPFMAGQLLQFRIGAFIRRHSVIVSLVDRGSIVMVVFLAFSEAMVAGIWTAVSASDLTMMIIVNVILLAFILVFTSILAKWLGFNREDRITILFCGSKKSLASGAPMASVLFSASVVGTIMLPLMVFHQLQLMACAILARRFAHQKLTSDSTPN